MEAVVFDEAPIDTLVGDLVNLICTTLLSELSVLCFSMTSKKFYKMLFKLVKRSFFPGTFDRKNLFEERSRTEVRRRKLGGLIGVEGTIEQWSFFANTLGWKPNL